jgi:hypothetical protein
MGARIGDRAECTMLTSLTLSSELLQEAIDLMGINTSIETLVESALRAYIDQYKRLQIIELFGTIDYDDDYDYKQQRAVG